MRRLVAVACVLGLGLGLMGCARAADDAGPHIGLAMSTLSNPFFVRLRDGAVAAGNQAGARMTVADAADDAKSQADQMQNFVAAGVDAIVVNPVDSAAIVPSIRAANSADIPVVTIDRGADGGDVAAHVISDNVAGGQMAGEYLIEQIGGSGSVAQVLGIPGASPTRDRGEGFATAVEQASKVEVVAEQPANFDRETGFTVTQNILQANPDLEGLFAQNDDMALGAVEAARQAGVLDELVIVGYDGIDDALVAIQEGELAATILQSDTMGSAGVTAALRVLDGQSVQSEQEIEVQQVTPDNVGEVR